MSNVLIAIGTRPDILKLIPVYEAFTAQGIRPYVCASGQHQELMDDALSGFHLPISHNLNALQHAQGLADISSFCIKAFNDILLQQQPRVVIVQGDTATAYSCAVAAFYNKIPIVHIEAGLRSGDVTSPFPEEFYRKSIADIAALHCAPTALAAHNILREKPFASVVVTGNTIIDTFNKITTALPVVTNNKKNINILVTMHRRESFNGGLESICKALQIIIDTYSDINLTLPMHPNPAVKKALEAACLVGNKQISLIPPLNYQSFISRLMESDIILTDSGGVQEEAAALGIATIIMRNVTERPECIWYGQAELVGTQSHAIVNAFNRWYAQPKKRRPTFVFGDGNAADKIADLVIKRYDLKKSE